MRLKSFPPRLGLAYAWCLLLLPLSVLAAAPDSPPAVAGLWKWTFTAPNGQTYERSAQLESQGNKLTGISTWPDGTKVEIQDGKIDGKWISFTLTRESNGQKTVSKYKGEVNGDTIKGQIESDSGAGKRTYDWQAKRQTSPKPPV
jgi:hypothetical protein